jgi:hypothetical protein
MPGFNPNQSFPGGTRPAAKLLTRRLSKITSLIFILSLLASACKPSGLPTSTPTPSQTPKPTEVATPTVTPLPTSVFNVSDDGKPLPPQVIAEAPSGGAGIGRDGMVSVTFDQAMDQNKTASAWKMVGPQDQPVEGQITWQDNHTLQFKPSAPLDYGQTYLASLSTGAVSAQGVALQSPFEFQVNTVSPLQVSQVFPADGTTDVANQAVITVIFNRPVVPLGIAEEKQNLPSPLNISPAVENGSTHRFTLSGRTSLYMAAWIIR